MGLAVSRALLLGQQRFDLTSRLGRGLGRFAAGWIVDFDNVENAADNDLGRIGNASVVALTAQITGTEVAQELLRLLFGQGDDLLFCLLSGPKPGDGGHQHRNTEARRRNADRVLTGKSLYRSSWWYPIPLPIPLSYQRRRSIQAPALDHSCQKKGHPSARCPMTLACSGWFDSDHHKVGG